MLLRISMCSELVFLLIILYTNAQFNKWEGDSCEIKQGLQGVCTLANKCQLANANLIATGRTNLPRCGFKKLIEIVCCPSVSSRFAEKSQNACNKYSTTSPVVFKPFIHGGTDAEDGEFPHMAALGYRENGNISFSCGGTLISERYVVTAAHCIINSRQTPPSIVKLGTTDTRETNGIKNGIEYMVENIINHPEYNPPMRYHDIALLRLNRNVAFTDKILPACLHTSTVNESIPHYATGWGILNRTDKNPHYKLQKITLPLADIPSCNTAHIPHSGKNYLSRGIDGTSMICAGTNNGTTDTCQGDSGGPLQIETENSTTWSIVGVTSFGGACGGSSLPGVYTKISNYIDWIESIVWA